MADTWKLPATPAACDAEILGALKQLIAGLGLKPKDVFHVSVRMFPPDSRRGMFQVKMPPTAEAHAEYLAMLTQTPLSQDSAPSAESSEPGPAPAHLDPASLSKLGQEFVSSMTRAAVCLLRVIEIAAATRTDANAES